jgi:DNA polymerase elongation subunit (family B)
MPQWQFKLFEYDIRDNFDSASDEYVPGKDNKKFVVQMFGIDEKGKTACIYVRGFDPFFYVKVGEDWDDGNMMEFTADIKRQMGSYYSDSLTKVKLVKKQKLYGFDNKKLHTFIQFKFKNIQALNKAKNLWYKDTNDNGRFERKLRPEGVIFKDINTELYEAQIPPLLRLFHIREISPSGWVALRQGTYMQHKKTYTTCDYEFTINYKKLVPIPKKETSVPFKILSLDIEASSSHGDFPLAKKNYIKLATNIIDYLTKYKIQCSEELLEKMILTSLGYDTVKGIDRIFLKKTISKEDMQNLVKELLLVKPAQLENHITFNEEEEEEEDEVEQENIVEEVGSKRKYKPVGHKNKEIFILDLINDESCARNTKLIELTKSFGQHNVKKNDIWEGLFPEVEGDRVTFIGSSLRRCGEEKPYLKHCIVVNTCDPIPNIEVESYETEKEALLAWTKFVQKENPDIIIGYNIHGWDEKFMFERSQELNCMKQFSKLSRNKNEECLKEVWQGPGRPKKITIEENNLFIASGQYDIRYFKMPGRLQIDFLHLFRRAEQLASYKLDYVASHFIGDNIKEFVYDEDKDITKIITKNLTGLENDDYIVIEEIGHTTDLYCDGKKFKIKNLTTNQFEIDGEITPDSAKTLRWCLGKDDVTPQDIFKLTNEGPEGRAIVGKYCLKDTTLIHDLMRKNDTLTSYTEMSNLCWVPMSFLVFRGQGIKLTSYVGQKCREKNTLMPVIEKSLDDEGYEGATVLDPKTGLYLDNPIACVDYSSLYPSSIISENLSHDSKVWTKEYDLEGNLIKEWGEKKDIEDLNCKEYLYDNLEGREYVDVKYDTFKWIRKTPKAAATKVKCGYKICRFIQPQDDNDKAILPAILEELLAARKSTKKQMKNEKDPFMVNVLDARQLSIKIAANSLYGQCGAKTSTFYDKDVAASTTGTGRKLLMFAKAVIEEAYGDSIQETKNHGKVKTNAEIIYGDTDSVFFTFNLTELDGSKIIGKKALEITIELAQYAGALVTKYLKNPHDLEYEKTFLPFCLLSKKRYVGMLYEFDINKCKRKSMGIVLKRRDNAPIVKDIYGGVIDILMNEQQVDKSLIYVKECLQNVVDEKYPQEKLIVTKSLRSYYKNPMQIAHNVLASRMGERDPGNKPGSGDRIPYIYFKNENKKALQGDKIEHPKFIIDNGLKIDYGFYITNQIMKPLLQLFALVLEQIPEFKTTRGRTMRSWKIDIEKLHEKWLDDEKFEKKYEEFRCKEVKKLLFDPYIKMVK